MHSYQEEGGPLKKQGSMVQLRKLLLATYYMYALAVAITIAILVTIPMLVYHSLHFCVLSSPLAAILRPMPHLLGLAWLAAVSADWTAGLLCLLHVHQLISPVIVINILYRCTGTALPNQQRAIWTQSTR
eukprot:COSAG01_NODE_6283_length_3754_cov_10.859644_2_plen_130_part_00